MQNHPGQNAWKHRQGKEETARLTLWISLQTSVRTIQDEKPRRKGKNKKVGRTQGVGTFRNFPRTCATSIHGTRSKTAEASRGSRGIKRKGISSRVQLSKSSSRTPSLKWTRCFVKPSSCANSKRDECMEACSPEHAHQSTRARMHGFAYTHQQARSEGIRSQKHCKRKSGRNSNEHLSQSELIFPTVCGPLHGMQCNKLKLVRISIECIASFDHHGVELMFQSSAPRSASDWSVHPCFYKEF